MKTTLIMKFGGAALETPQHFLRVAEIIAERRAHYSRVVVVVSAMGTMTDELMQLAFTISPSPPRREQDMLVSVGERISMSLLAMALKEQGQEAISLTGSQSGIITCHRHSEAQIRDVRPKRILEHLDQSKIVIVAGFQGVSFEKEITTLGRGGSDTSAVALGVALGAEKIEFYKDVLGVYSEDPKKNSQAKLYESLSYQEALSLAKNPSFVLHPRAIFLASKNGLPLHVLTFKRGQSEAFPGTLIRGKPSAPQTELHYENDHHPESY